MKVLHVLSQQQLTGAEVYAGTLARAQKERGDVVYGVSDTFTLPFPGEVYTLPIGRRSWLHRLRNIIWLMHFIRRKRIQVVHAHSRAAAWVAYVACKLTGTPLVSTVHGLQPVHASSRRFRVLGRHIIAVCEALKTHLVRDLGYPANSIRVIPNGFSSEVWTPQPPPPELLTSVPPGTRIWLYAGRFSPHKGEIARRLLRSIAQCWQRFENVQLYLIGGTTIPADLLSQAEWLNSIAGRRWVVLLDYTPRLPQWMRSAELVIGAGRVAIEGLLLGKPVIAFGEQGYWGLITPGNCFDAQTTNFGDVGGPPWPSEAALSTELCQYLESPPHPLPENLTMQLRAFYAIETVETKVRLLYEESQADCF